MDIIPPRKKPVPSSVEPQEAPRAPELAKQPKSPKTHVFALKRRYSWKWWVAAGLAALAILAIVAVNVWYFAALQPLKPGSDEQIRVKVTTGETVSEIGNNLKKAGVVRSAVAFRVYAELNGTKSKLKAGGYTVSPSQSIPDIINHLVNGNGDELTITIPPGVSTLGIREELKKHGYSDAEITRALNADYDSPLLADKPANVSLDGYIFPETFNVDPNDPLESLFERSFDELYAKLQTDGMIQKFKAKRLDIHQALTLASIIQMEEPDFADQRKVAQVFHLRLKQGMALESDPTFVYAANQRGVTPSVNIDSPYNTRKHAGLPPGPIATMNYSAIQAVVDPAPGDYLYFVAGDNQKTYFARTLEEHLENVEKHCHDLCNKY